MKSRTAIVPALLLSVITAAAIACVSSGAARPTARLAVGEEQTAGLAPSAPSMVEVPAPIESVEVEIAESDPPQYFLVVRSELSNGCVKLYDYEVTRRGSSVNVEVTNLEPADDGTVCTKVYRTVETRIPLGSDFRSAEPYTVNVNDLTTSLKAPPRVYPGPGDVRTLEPAPIELVRVDYQSGPSNHSELVVVNDTAKTFVARRETESRGEQDQAEGPNLDTPFRLGLRDTTVIESEGLVVSFDAVLEDSRCPSNVNCIQAGQARIRLHVSKGGEELGKLELVLGAGRGEGARKTLGAYSVAVIRLDPYPAVPGPKHGKGSPGYTATLLVSRVGAGNPGGRPWAGLGPVDLALSVHAQPNN